MLCVWSRCPDAEREKALEQGSRRLRNGFPGQQAVHVGLWRVRSGLYILAGHVPILELATGSLLVADNGHAAVPVVPLDAAQAFLRGGPFAFDALHEIEPVVQDQAGDGKTRIVALRSRHDRQQVIRGQARPCRAHVNKRGD